jgi:hypothetical protein
MPNPAIVIVGHKIASDLKKYIVLALRHDGRP